MIDKGRWGMGKGKYASWMDSLLEEGIWLSEFKKLAKEKFPGVEVNLKAHVCYRRAQGWKIEEKCEGDDIFYKVVEKSEGKIQYASWMDSLLEEGVWLSEFKKLAKERLPGVNVSLTYHVRYRRSQGWKIVEERQENGDVFYKVVEKPEKKQRKGKGSNGSGVVVKEAKSMSEGLVSGEVEKEESKVVGGSSGEVSKQKVVYILKEVDDSKFKLSVKVGTESKVVEFSDGDVEDVIGKVFGGVAEVKSIDREEEGVEKGVFILYKYIGQ
jgi:hypothetical protein